jgi:hypothetical protein
MIDIHRFETGISLYSFGVRHYERVVSAIPVPPSCDIWANHTQAMEQWLCRLLREYKAELCVVSCLKLKVVTLETEEVSCSETLSFYQTIRRHTLENCTLDGHGCDNLKPDIAKLSFVCC